MIVYVNDKNEIKAVGSTTDPSLIAKSINDNDNPFDGWSDAKICCYKVRITNGQVISMSPYVDTKLIEHFDQVGKQGNSVSSEYSGSHVYVKDEYCMYGGSLYRFTKTKGVGIMPTDRNYWDSCDVASELNRIMSLMKDKEM